MSTEDFDLPDPKPRKMLSPDELRLQRFLLSRNLFIFSALYGCLHKIVIPLFLSQTTVLIRDYAKIDLWAIPGLILAIYLLKSKKVDATASLLAGGLVAYGCWDARALFLGQHQGWLAWSHAVSSLPQAGMAIFLLTSQRHTRSLKAAWIGALTAFAFLSASPRPHLAQATHDTSQATTQKLIPILADACGAQEFQITRENFVESEHLYLKDCGFSPAAIKIKPSAKLALIRSNNSFLNIHFSFFDSHGQRKRQSNRIFKPNATKEVLSEFSFAPDEVAAILYSDAAPQLGKVLIINEAHAGDFQSAGVTLSRELIWNSKP